MHPHLTSTQVGRPAKIITITIEGPHGCWIPSTPPNKNGGGYVQIWNGTRMVRLHRLMYERAKGEIPEGYEAHHKCSNPPCCNPDHVESLPIAEHRRMKYGSTKHCPQGHHYAGENLAERIDRKGHRRRVCRTCQRAADLEWARNKARKLTNDPNHVFVAQGKKTHCPQGHPYEGDNLIQTWSKQGGSIRNCRACQRNRGREWERRKRRERRENAPPA